MHVLTPFGLGEIDAVRLYLRVFLTMQQKRCNVLFWTNQRLSLDEYLACFFEWKTISFSDFVLTDIGCPDFKIDLLKNFPVFYMKCCSRLYGLFCGHYKDFSGSSSGLRVTTKHWLNDGCFVGWRFPRDNPFWLGGKGYAQALSRCITMALIPAIWGEDTYLRNHYILVLLFNRIGRIPMASELPRIQ